MTKDPNKFTEVTLHMKSGIVQVFCSYTFSFEVRGSDLTAMTWDKTVVKGAKHAAIRKAPDFIDLKEIAMIETTIYELESA